MKNVYAWEVMQAGLCVKLTCCEVGHSWHAHFLFTFIISEWNKHYSLSSSAGWSTNPMFLWESETNANPTWITEDLYFKTTYFAFTVTTISLLMDFTNDNLIMDHKYFIGWILSVRIWSFGFSFCAWTKGFCCFFYCFKKRHLNLEDIWFCTK